MARRSPSEPASASSDPLPADLGRRLDPVHGNLPDPGPLSFAAVLAAITGPIHDPSLLLIERPGGMRTHAGQLAFPGGKPDPDDGDLLRTALREAEEEVGLPAGEVRVLGRLDPVPTPTGFFIVPFVGRVEPQWEPSIRSEQEVARVLTPSFRQLQDPTVHTVDGRRKWRGVVYDLHRYDVADPPLWGATARMVWDLLERLRTG